MEPLRLRETTCRCVAGIVQTFGGGYVALMARSSFRDFTIAAAALILAGCSQGSEEAVVNARCVMDGLEQVGGPISLQDQTGAAITEAELSGSPTLLYFGFASCPDICPLALTTARAALEALQPGSPAVKVAFITLDPERDDLPTLGAYVETPIFPDDTIGLGGEREAVDAAASAFRVVHRRRDDPDSALGYSIDHSSFFYLMGEDWRTRALFPSSLPAEEMARCIDVALAKG